MERAPKSLALLTVGAGIGVLALLFHHWHSRKERQQLLRHIASLQRDVTDLRQQVQQLRTLSGGVVSRNGSRGGGGEARERRRRSRGSGYDSDATMFSAVDTDDTDEFYDISSDEEDTIVAGEVGHLFAEVDRLMMTPEGHARALEKLLTHIQHLSTHPDFLWRLAKAYKLKVDAAIQSGDKEDLLQYIEKGVELAERACQLEPGNGEARKWLAIHVGLRSDFLPTKQKLENGILFQQLVQLALKALPQDHTLHHLLARFNFAVANLSWLERKAANLLGELPDVTLDDAILDAEKAEALTPQPWAENRLLLAKAYLAKADYITGLDWLNRAQLAQTNSDVTKKEIDELLTKYKKYRL